MKSRFAVLVAAAGLLPALACAGPQQAQMMWAGWNGSLRLDPHWSLTGELQLRSFDNWDGVRAVELRPGVSYALSPTLTVAGGVGLIRNRDLVREDSSESRLWTQLVAVTQASKLRVTNRLRLEERFLELPGQPDVDGLRLRYQIRAQYPLQSDLPLLHDSYLLALNEVSVNLIHAEQLNGHRLDQVRTAAGIGHRVNRSVDVEMNYLHVYLVGRRDDTRNHVFQVSLTTRF